MAIDGGEKIFKNYITHCMSRSINYKLPKKKLSTSEKGYLKENSYSYKVKYPWF